MPFLVWQGRVSWCLFFFFFPIPPLTAFSTLDMIPLAGNGGDDDDSLNRVLSEIFADIELRVVHS